MLHKTAEDYKGEPPEGIDGNDVVYYNGAYYEHIINWYPTGKISKKDKAWFGSIYDKIAIYENDSDAIFIHHKTLLSDENYYHKKDDILPKQYSEDATIVFSVQIDENDFNKRKEVTLTDNKLASDFKVFIEKCINTPDEVIKETGRVSNESFIYIYFENYPAYNVLGSLRILDTGKVVMNTFNTNNVTGYFLLPDDISGQIKKLIEI